MVKFVYVHRLNYLDSSYFLHTKIRQVRKRRVSSKEKSYKILRKKILKLLRKLVYNHRSEISFTFYKNKTNKYHFLIQIYNNLKNCLQLGSKDKKNLRFQNSKQRIQKGFLMNFNCILLIMSYFNLTICIFYLNLKLLQIFTKTYRF